MNQVKPCLKKKGDLRKTITFNLDALSFQETQFEKMTFMVITGWMSGGLSG